ncbi:MAG: serine/threonine protein kinase [Gammaproteobacteria bacterium]|nr:serine/threonine protein kinase [Gammaproteobacteria bacterium]
MTDLRLVHPETSNAPRPDPASQTRVMQNDHAASANIEAGSTLGNYLVISKIGEGGMGLVYKAHDTTLDRMVALKVVSPHLFRNQEFLNRFRIEAQAQARLNGPNIVTLHSMFDYAGSLVLVMEYVEGQTLEQRLQKEGKLSVATTVWVFEQALLGIERAHRMGIVHRDLKPSNIFITTAHEIKLMDFGVAKILDNKANTQSGSMIGTLMYISPEQIKGHDADFRSDIYTFGITLYQAVTGVLPFEKKTDYEYMNAHLHEQPLPPTALQPAIPQELEDIILKAMEKDPDKRFQNAHEFRKALLKVGMVHVRAYRRLKTIRREKDRAALGPGSSSQKEKESGLLAFWEDFSERLIENRKLAITGSVAAVAIVGLMVALLIGVGKNHVPVAPVAPVEATVPSSESTATAAAEAPKPEVAEKPAAKPPAKTVAEAPPAKPAPVQREAVAPRKAEEKKKYDSLKKAWGG